MEKVIVKKTGVVNHNEAFLCIFLVIANNISLPRRCAENDIQKSLW